MSSPTIAQLWVPCIDLCRAVLFFVADKAVGAVLDKLDQRLRYSGVWSYASKVGTFVWSVFIVSLFYYDTLFSSRYPYHIAGK